MQVKRKLQLNVVLSVAAAATVLLVLSFATYRVIRAVEASDIAGKIISGAFERVTLRNDYVHSGNERARVQWLSKHEEVGRLLTTAAEKFRDPADQKIIAEMIADHASIGRINSGILKNREKVTDPTRMGELSVETEERLLTQINMKIYGLVLQARGLQESSRETLFSVLWLAGWGIAGVLVLVFAAVIVNSWTMGRSITERIRLLRDGASMIGEGNLDHRIEVKGEDELAELSGAFNAMTAKLRGSYRELENEIGERRRAEAELDASQRHWVTTLSSIGDAVIATDASGRVSFMNPVAQALTGWRPEEALGQSVQSVFGIIDDESHEPGEDIVARVLAEGSVVSLANHTALVAREGREIPIEDSAAPIKNSEGRIVGAVLVFHDVSEKRKARQALQESERRLRRFYESRLLGVFFWNMNGEITEANDKFLEMVGYDREDLAAGRIDWDRMTPPEYRHLDEDSVAELKAAGVNEKPFEKEYIRKDGARIPIMVAGAMLDEPHFNGVAFVLDITERKHADQVLAEHVARLEAVNRELENYSYTVTHDLRVPLRAIDGFSRIILTRQGERFDEETRRQFQVIRENIRSIEKLIEDLLVFSRLGRKDIAPVTLDVEEMIREVWGELVTANPGRELSLTCEPVPAARADRALIRQVLENLLDNAVKFARGREKAVIEVGSHVMNIGTVYYVKDNGIGFDMKYYDRLFGLFQRLPNAEGYDGTGMGLALAQRIIHKHGGRVWAEGKVDEGATLYFTLPG